jgi:hypothetical protein
MLAARSGILHTGLSRLTLVQRANDLSGISELKSALRWPDFLF